MVSSRLDPYAHLSLRDRLELLIFDLRLAGVPAGTLRPLWDAVDYLDAGDRKRPGYREPTGMKAP